MSSDRISRDELFMSVARLFGMRSTCPRALVGVIAVSEGRIVACGYVGAPIGEPHCVDEGCIMEDNHCIRTTHAEANMISWAAREGISLYESTIYCTHKPCFACAKLIANLGIIELVYADDYRDDRGTDLLRRQDVMLRRYDALESTS